MPYQVLARKYRPQKFGDVAGQDHVTRTLQNALEQGRIAHGYIFSGHRGIGKTTIARILAAALNCQNTIGSPLRPTPEPCGVCDSCTEIRAGNAVDVIEIDAATNRGIDEIRELRDAARYRPARDKYKIYILDEAHQITDAAFNALLKTLEEPPDHIVFMMATTEPENIPQTIRSRCQHFSFHAVKFDDILSELRKVVDKEDVIADEAALALLAEAGDGSMRDALSIMDQAIASAPVVRSSGSAGGSARGNGDLEKPVLSATEIRDLMGTVPNAVFEELLSHISAGQSEPVLTTAGRLLDAGNSPQQIARQFVRYLRNTVVARISGLTEDGPTSDLLQISPDERRRAIRSSLLFTEEELTRFLQIMLRTFDDLGFRQEQRLHLELGLLKLVHLQRLLPVEELLSKLPRSTGSTPLPTPAPRANVTPSQQPQDGVPHPREAGLGAATTGTSPTSSFRSDVEAPAAHQAPKPPDRPQSEAKPEDSAASALDTAKPAPSSLAPAAATHQSAEDATLHQPGAKLQEIPPRESATALPQAIAEAKPERSESVEPTQSEASIDATALQTAAVEALFATNKHNSAAEQLETTKWTLNEGGEMQIQTSLSKQMISTIFRPDVEAIIKNTLRSSGLPAARLSFLTAPKEDLAPKTPKKPRAGTAQALALEHPTVQAAQKLFNAEITNVFDLRRD